MADATSAVVVDTDEWVYVDSSGVEHKVTNAEGFNMTISDDGTTDVQWNVPIGQTVATDDGYNITFRPQVTGTPTFLQIETLSDTIPGQGFQYPVINGEIPMSIDTDNVIQIWKVAKLVPSDTDCAGGTPTMECHFEDQFGNTMFWKAGMSIGVAA